MTIEVVLWLSIIFLYGIWFIILFYEGIACLVRAYKTKFTSARIFYIDASKVMFIIMGMPIVNFVLGWQMLVAHINGEDEDDE